MALHTQTTVIVKAEGREVKLEQFTSLEIHQSVADHHFFQIVIDRDWLAGTGNVFNQVKDLIGKEIIITIKPDNLQLKGSPLVFKGIVTELNGGRAGGGAQGVCIIKGYSTTILLQDDPHIEAFENKTLAAILKKVIKDYPANLLKTTMQPVLNGALPYIVQYRENAFEFIKRLSVRYGEWMFYDGEQLVVGRPAGEKVKLVYNHNLQSFQLDMRTVPHNINYAFYDIANAGAVFSDTASKEPGQMSAFMEHVAGQSQTLYAKQALQKLNQDLNGAPQQQLEAMAALSKKGRIAQMITMKGNSDDTGVGIGKTIEVQESPYQGEGGSYGDYTVIAVSHICNGKGEYQNVFTAVPSGAAVPYTNVNASPFAEAQSATVIENHDPKGMGRIRVRFQWQSQGMTPWIRIISTAGGGDKGFFIIPEKGEEVWIGFEGGNPEMPYVMGTTYNGKATTAFSDPDNNRKVIKSRNGHIIELNDTGGNESITITDKSGNIIVFDTKESSIMMTAPETFVINAKNFHVIAKENITLTTQEQDIIVTSKRNIGVTGQQNIRMNTVEQDIAIAGKKNVSINARTKNVNIAASKSLNANGRLSASIQSLVSLSMMSGVKANMKSGKTNVI